MVAKTAKAPSLTGGNPFDGAMPLDIAPAMAKPWLQPAPKPPSPLPSRADAAGVVVSGEAASANRRLVDHLKTTREDGPLPITLAGDAGQNANGHAQVDNFFAQLHEHLPERARTRGAKVRKLMDQANPPKPAKAAANVETRPVPIDTPGEYQHVLYGNFKKMEYSYGNATAAPARRQIHAAGNARS